MPRLIHLNGPPGVGKSTFARRYADEHPPTLCLDVDLIVSMLGGWQDDFWGSLPLARQLAAELARVHLEAGHDVVLPQLVTSRAGLDPYVAAARVSSATYVEIVLIAEQATTIARFERRLEPGATEFEQQLAQAVLADGEWLLVKIRADLDTYLAVTDERILVDTSRLDADATYEAVCKAAGL